jgi:Na+/H+-dicarboxylate symporter
VVGLALGIAAGAARASPALRAVRWLEPIGTMWVNAIRATVIPLVVSSLVVAVAGTGARTVGRLGWRAFTIFIVLLVALALPAVLVAPVVFAPLSIDPVAAASIRAGAGAVQRPELPTFGGWLVGLVPTNPIRAAADGAMLPLVLFALAFGLALGRLAPGLRAAAVAFFGGVADAMTVLVAWLLAVAPIGVFALALSLAANLGSGVVGAAAFYLVAHVALLVGALLFLYVVVALFGGVSVARFARAALPGQVVAVTTRSSVAALPAMLASAKALLGLPSAVTSFALPLAVTTFRVNQPVCWVVMALFAARLYGVPLGPAQLATVAVMAVLMSFSVPGIPSGGLFIVAPFFASVGIPPESIGVLIALDLVPDAFKTLTNVTGHLTAVTLLGRGERAAPGVRGAGAR